MRIYSPRATGWFARVAPPVTYLAGRDSSRRFLSVPLNSAVLGPFYGIGFYDRYIGCDSRENVMIGMKHMCIMTARCMYVETANRAMECESKIKSNKNSRHSVFD